MDLYNRTIQYLFSKLPMYQRTGAQAYKNSLENIKKLDAFYGHPHKDFKIIHIAGTNGKGSVSHMLAAILQSAGYKTGLFTSPHLKDFRERIRINGKMILKSEIISFVNDFFQKNKKWKLEPSFFELNTAIAFKYFSQKNVDIAIIETGLGGRLDSTNIVCPEISVITNIGLDHTKFLGNTLGKIALEKAGIIKRRIPAIIGEFQDEIVNIFNEVGKKRESPIYFADREYIIEYSLMDVKENQVFQVKKNNKIIYPDLKTGLGGKYQQKNIPAVLKVCDLLVQNGWKISERNIYQGLLNVIELTGFYGRWQILGHQPLIVCDTAHNAEGIREVISQIKQNAYKKLHIVFGIVEDKEIQKILNLLPPEAIYYFTKASIPRALNEVILYNEAQKTGLKGDIFSNVPDAVQRAKEKAEPEDMIFIGGSTFVVAEIL